MPTRTASETLNTHPSDRPELQRSTHRQRLAKAGEMLDQAIEHRDATMRVVLARLRGSHPTAPEAAIQGWLHVDADYIRAVERHEAAKWDLHEIENLDHGSIQPSEIEMAKAEVDCSFRRRSWRGFMRTLDRETRRRHALRRHRPMPTVSTGRQSRSSTSTRSRGSKRTTTSSSSSGGGDSGSSGDPDPSGQAQAGRENDTEHRYCRGCGLRLDGYAPQARDHSPACTTRWRRRGKVAAEPVDGVDYGPGCQTAAEIQAAIEAHRNGHRHYYQRVTADTDLNTVLELVEMAIQDRRSAWQVGDAENIVRLDYDLDRLWAAVRERKDSMGDPVYRSAGRRLQG